MSYAATALMFDEALSTDPGILRPVRHQFPAGERDLAAIVARSDNGDLLRWRDVVARAKVQHRLPIVDAVGPDKLRPRYLIRFRCAYR